MAESKPTKHSGLRKFISSILSDVEKFTEFFGTIILQIPAKDIAWKLVRLELTLVLNPFILL